MFFLSIVSFFMTVFVPGFGLQKLFFPQIPLRYRILLSLPLSMIVNYVVVFSCYYMGLLTTTNLRFVAILQILGVLFLYRKQIWSFDLANFLNRYKKKTMDFFDELQLSPLLQIVIVAMIGVLLVGIIVNAQTVFTNWDAVFSWNRWAMDWFVPRWPIGTAHYPQLFPVNWAYSYFLIGTEFQSVPRAMMALSLPLFFFTSIVFSFHFQLPSRSAVFAILWTAVVYGFLMTFIYDGYVDGPVAIWGYLCFHLLCFTDLRSEDEKRYLTLMGLLILAFLPLVKQAGWVLYIPFLTIFIVQKKWKFVSLKSAIVIALLFLVYTVGYYAIVEYKISQGSDHSEISFVTGGIYNGQVIYERCWEALKLLFRVKMAWVVLLSAVLVFMSHCRSRFLDKSQWVSLYFFAYFLIWMCFYSYDQRNAMICVPFLLFFAFIQNANFVQKSLDKNNLIKKGFVAVLFVAVIPVIPKYGKDDLLQSHRIKKLMPGNPAVNQFILGLYSDPKFKLLDIEGDYPYIVNLDGPRYLYKHTFFKTREEVLKSIPVTTEKLFVISDLSSEEARKTFFELSNRGQIKLIFQSEDVRIYAREKSN